MDIKKQQQQPQKKINPAQQKSNPQQKTNLPTNSNKNAPQKRA